MFKYMGVKKRYFCCICRKELINVKPIRLQERKYGVGRYQQYYPTDNYDFCEKCYKLFLEWLEQNGALSNREIEDEEDLW